MRKGMKYCLFLFLLCHLVKLSHSQYPYISYNEQILPNHAYLRLHTSINVKCHTDLASCCNRTYGIHYGNWYTPSGLIITNQDAVPGLMIIDLRVTTFSISGIYYCTIPTQSNLAGDSVYVGLYNSGGDVTIDFLTLDVNSDLNGDGPQFTLVCKSSGGPATTVTWSRNSLDVTGTSNTVLESSLYSRYIHSLTVTGREWGNYECSVSNDKPSSDLRSFIVEVATSPTNTRAVQLDATSIQVTWSKPYPLGETDGYKISYTGSRSSELVVIGENTEEGILRNLLNGVRYTISIAGTSEHFNSQSVHVTSVGLVPWMLDISESYASTNYIDVSLSVDRGSVVNRYTVMWEADQCSHDVHEGEDDVTSIFVPTTYHEIHNLRAGTIYHISFIATNSAGTSSRSRVINVRTMEKAPTAAPTSIEVSRITFSSVTVHWGPIECGYRNGFIIGYQITYMALDSNDGTQSMSVPGDSNGGMATITGLSSSTTYRIEVAARNGAGIGDQSASLFVKTLDSVYLSVNDEYSVIPNHGYVNITTIGHSEMTAIICNTNKDDGIYDSNEGWFAPDLTQNDNIQGFVTRQMASAIRLYRNASENVLQEGMYRCTARDDTHALKSLYVGLYSGGRGRVTLSIHFDLVTRNLDADMPEFRLNCSSGGGPATTVTWTRGNEMITEGVESMIIRQDTAQYHHILRVIGKKEGNYVCRVSNNAGSVTANLNVEVPSAPTYVSVSQTGIKSIQVSWRSQGDVTGFRIFYEEDRSVTADKLERSIIIDNLNIQQTYVITVLATSTTLPSDESNPIDFTIESTTIRLTSSPSPSSITAGNTVTITCSVTLPSGVTDTPSFQWRGPDGETHIPTNPTTSGQTVSSVIKIKKIRTSQAGQYTCRASLSGSVSDDISISVEVPPPAVTTTLSHSAPVYTGTRLVITCKVTISPYLDSNEIFSATWRCPASNDCDQTDFTESPANVYTSRLSVTRVAKEDEGRYTCTATITDAQQMTVSIADYVILTVREIPSPEVTIISSATSELSTVGLPYSLTCSAMIVADLVAEPIIQWIGQDGRIINSSLDTIIQLNFNPLYKSNSSLYTCKITVNITELDVVLSEEASYEILLDIPSGYPEMFTAVAGQRQVNFSWSPPLPAQQNGVIIGYMLSCSPSPSSLPLSTSQSGSFTVTGFSPNTEYSCSVVASNGLGSGPPAVIIFSTQQDYSFFEVCLNGFTMESCCDVLATGEQVKQTISKAVLTQLNSSCIECSRTYNAIDMQELSCYSANLTNGTYIVKYATRLEGTSVIDSLTVKSLVEEWVNDGDINMTVSEVPIMLDLKCFGIDSNSSESDCLSTPLPIEIYIAVAMGGLVVISAISVVVIISTLIVKRRRKRHIKGMGQNACKNGVSVDKLIDKVHTRETVEEEEEIYTDVITTKKHLKDVVIEEALYEQIGRGGSGIVLKKNIKKPLLPKAVDKNEGAIAVIGNEAYDSGIHESDIADTKMDDIHVKDQHFKAKEPGKAKTTNNKKPLLPKVVDKNEGAIAVIGNEAYDSGIHESDIADTKMDDIHVKDQHFKAKKSGTINKTHTKTVTVENDDYYGEKKDKEETVYDVVKELSQKSAGGKKEPPKLPPVIPKKSRSVWSSILKLPSLKPSPITPAVQVQVNKNATTSSTTPSDQPTYYSYPKKPFHLNAKTRKDSPPKNKPPLKPKPSDLPSYMNTTSSKKPPPPPSRATPSDESTYYSYPKKPFHLNAKTRKDSPPTNKPPLKPKPSDLLSYMNTTSSKKPPPPPSRATPSDESSYYLYPIKFNPENSKDSSSPLKTPPSTKGSGQSTYYSYPMCLIGTGSKKSSKAPPTPSDKPPYYSLPIKKAKSKKTETANGLPSLPKAPQSKKKPFSNPQPPSDQHKKPLTKLKPSISTPNVSSPVESKVKVPLMPPSLRLSSPNVAVQNAKPRKTTPPPPPPDKPSSNQQLSFPLVKDLSTSRVGNIIIKEMKGKQ